MNFLILSLELAQSGVTPVWGFVHLLEGRGDCVLLFQ